MKIKTNICTTLIFLLVTVLLYGQDSPPVKVYTSKDYGAESQNWSIAQSKNNFIYVANNQGLLEFNGAKWNLYPSPNETIVRSVRVIDDLIYTGCSKEFGYWQRNEFGLLFYTSLSKQLKIDFLEGEEFWDIVSINDYILFQSLKRIYIYDKTNNSYSIIDSDTNIYKMFKVDESIYFQETRNGLYKIESGKSILVSNAQLLKNDLLVNVFNHNSGNLLIETESNGFYFLDNGELVKWNIQDDIISKSGVYRSTKLRDGSFILGTRSDGIVHITDKGEVDNYINTLNGLSNNTIHFIFEDAENNIWLALDNGINCINFKSPFRIFNDLEGRIGTVYASAIYKDYLYLGSNQGLYCRPINSNESFKFVEGTQGPVWCLKEFKDSLFCGHNIGTFLVNKDSASLIADIQGTWDIESLNEEDNMLLQGNYNGLNIIEMKDGKWQFKNKIEGFNVSSRFFSINNNQIFVTHGSKDIFTVTVNNEYTKALSIVKDTLSGRGLNCSITKYNDDIIYAYKRGVFKYNLTEEKFLKDTILSKLYSSEEYTSGKLISNKASNILWNFSKNNLNYVTRDNLNGKSILNKIPYSSEFPKGLTGYENITALKNNKYIIGSSNGYVTIDIDKLEEKAYDISINSITNSSIGDSPKYVDKGLEGVFKNKNNNIEFSFGVVEFDKYLETEYQYQLVGMYPDWSSWFSEPNVSFKNLPFGDYVFNVKARVGNTLSKNIATYSFSIERPWYFSNMLIALYIIIFFIDFIYNA